MIIPERRKAIGTILSKFKKDGSVEKFSNGGPVGESEMPDMDEAKHAHSSAMIEAFHNKDPKALTSAMNSFLEEHQLHQEKDKEETSDYKP